MDEAVTQPFGGMNHSAKPVEAGARAKEANELYTLRGA
jgi:hypothetical protein